MAKRRAAAQEERIHPTVVLAAVRALAALDPDAPAPPDPAQPVPRSQKLAILDRLEALGGPAAALAAGQYLRAVPDDPLLAVLLNADSVGVLMDKLAGLNRYFHANHRYAVVAASETTLTLDHMAMHGDPPLPIESLFTCGLYIALMEEIGCGGLTCRLPAADGTLHTVHRDGRALAPAPGNWARWDFAWTEFAARRPLPGIDRLAMQHLPPDLAASALSDRIRAVITSDLARKWRIPDVVRHVAISPRSLQRHLRDEGTSFSRLLTEARIGNAKQMLWHTTQPVTAIGYVCGFADTAHFTRTFKAATHKTPTEWRGQQATRTA